MMPNPNLLIASFCFRSKNWPRAELGLVAEVMVVLVVVTFMFMSRDMLTDVNVDVNAVLVLIDVTCAPFT